jgi:hypothetical protein
MHPRQWREQGMPDEPPLDELVTLDYLHSLNPILQSKFPPRDPKVTPCAYTYNTETGDLEEAFSSASSSHNALKYWQPPRPDEDNWINTDRGSGRNRARKDVKFDVVSTPSSPEPRRMQSTPTTPYTLYTAFKSSDQIFGARPHRYSPPPSVRVVGGADSNILFGMAQPRSSMDPFSAPSRTLNPSSQAFVRQLPPPSATSTHSLLLQTKWG